MRQVHRKKVDLALDPGDLRQRPAKNPAAHGQDCAAQTPRAAADVAPAGSSFTMVIPPIWSMTEIAQWSLSASRSATADAQAEQKGQQQSAHPECGIGGHRFLWRRSGLRLPASANVLYQDCGEPGRSGRASGISLPPPDKFVGLTMVPCGGMPHDPAEEYGAWRTSADEPITGASDAGHEAARNPVSRTQRTMAAL